MLDESLTWSSHIIMLNGKLRRENGLVAKDIIPHVCYWQLYIILFFELSMDMVVEFRDKPETNMQVMLSNYKGCSENNPLCNKHTSKKPLFNELRYYLLMKLSI